MTEPPRRIHPVPAVDDSAFAGQDAVPPRRRFLPDVRSRRWSVRPPPSAPAHLLAQGQPPGSPPAIPESMKTPGATVGGARVYGKPSSFEGKVIRNVPTAAQYNRDQVTRTGPLLQDLDGIITPNGLFYERIMVACPTSTRRRIA